MIRSRWSTAPPRRLSAGEQADAIMIDFHADVQRKAGDGLSLDGRVSLVVGTRTHAPTADHRIMPGGTAFQSDIGMSGDYQSVIGMDMNEPLRRFCKAPVERSRRRTVRPRCRRRGGDRRRHGLATGVGPVQLGGILEETRPVFWLAKG